MRWLPVNIFLQVLCVYWDIRHGICWRLFRVPSRPLEHTLFLVFLCYDWHYASAVRLLENQTSIFGKHFTLRAVQ